jgi:hypothetical protein
MFSFPFSDLSNDDLKELFPCNGDLAQWDGYEHYFWNGHWYPCQEVHDPLVYDYPWEVYDMKLIE